MVNEAQNQEGVTENLRKQLAVAVRSIQWSYIIFWSSLTSNQGVLKWSDGYYNGDIKTRKTFEIAKQLNPGKMGLHRSEQLKELYESLLLEGEDECESEDEIEGNHNQICLLLHCLLRIFRTPSGITWFACPLCSIKAKRRALEMNQAVWLADAQYADNEVFSRSLLAKSASIQTIVCFPYLGGVIELGINDQVLEDPRIVQHVKASLLDLSKLVCSEKSSCQNDDDDNDPMCALVNRRVKEEKNYAKNNFNNDPMCALDSPDGLSNYETSLVPIFMDDDCSNGCLHVSMTSSQCKLAYLNEDLHNMSTISTLLGTSRRLERSTLHQGCNRKSRFVSWKKTVADGYINKRRVKQGLLKKILFSVPLMHGASVKKDQIPQVDTNFTILKSMGPCISKIDKAAILIVTISYVKGLEVRLEKLESTLIDKEAIKKSWLNKRKACEMDKTEDLGTSSSGVVINGDDHLPRDMKVSIEGQEVFIELQCSWREYLLLEIIDAIKNTQLDGQSNQSSTYIGVFSFALTSKFRGSALTLVRKIKQELLKVTGQC